MGERGAGQYPRGLLRIDARPYRGNREVGGGPRAAQASRGAGHHPPRRPRNHDPRRLIHPGPRARFHIQSKMTQQTASFVNIGERTNVTGSARFQKLIMAGDYAAAVEVAPPTSENGAQITVPNMTRDRKKDG